MITNTRAEDGGGKTIWVTPTIPSTTHIWQVSSQVTQPDIKKTQTKPRSTCCPSCPAAKRGLYLSPSRSTRFQKTLSAVCWGPSWKIPQEVQSPVSSCNRILKFTSARTNCAARTRDVPSPDKKPSAARGWTEEMMLSAAMDKNYIYF